MLDLRRLYYFTAVAEELHFGRAAARLRIAQPPLSQQVKKLEGELGVRLLHRDRGRSVELTEAGRVLLEEGKDVLRRADHAASAAQRAARGEIGHLRVGFVSSATNVILPLTVRAFRARCPVVTLDLNQLVPEEQLERLQRGELDIAFTRPPLQDSAFASRVVVREPLVAVLPEGHRDAQRRRVSLADLAEELFVMEPRWVVPAWYDDMLALCRRHGFSPRIVQEAATVQTLLGLVAAGVGIALQPASVQALRRAGVVTVKVVAPKVETLLVWQRGETSAAARTFIDATMRVAREEGLVRVRRRA